MATLAEIAAIKRKMVGQTENVDNQSLSQAYEGPVSSYMSPGLTIAPPAATPFTPNVSAAPGSLGPLATDANVNAAYQALMSYMAQADQDRGNFSRQLTDQLGQSQQGRMKSLMSANQSLADRGLGNSGIALGKQGDVNTLYDQYDSSTNNAYQDNLHTLDRNTLSLQGGYENAQIAASAKYTQDQAEAAASALAQQNAADAQAQQMRDLIASLMPPQGEILSAPAPAQPIMTNPIVYGAAPKPRPIPRPVSTAAAGPNQIKQVIRGGPQ